MSRRALAIVLAASVLFFALFAADLVFHGPVTDADAGVSLWLHEHMQPVFTSVLFAFTHVHSTLGLSIMSGLLAVFLALRKRVALIGWMLLTVPGGQILNVVVKDIFHRARPHWDQPLVTLSSFSFPSGHAAGSTVFWGFVLVACGALDAPVWVRRTLAVAGVIAVALTALSRVYLGAHYLSDVLAGICEGTAWVCACKLAMDARTIRA